MKIPEQLFIQANENLRATDAKRDRMFYLFVVIFGLFLNFYKGITDNGEPIYLIAGGFAVVFGITVSIVLINYQVWHEVYVSSAIVIQKAIFQNTTESINKELIEKLASTVCKQKAKIGYGASFYLFNSVLIINCVFISLVAQMSIAKIIPEYWVFILAATLILYLSLFNIYYKRSIRKARDQLINISWLLKS
jgi:Flp pilus assembly protein TadB